MTREQSPRGAIAATRVASPWRAAGGAGIVAAALAALLTIDGDVFGLVMTDTHRVLACLGVGVAVALVVFVVRRSS